jgi:membrane protein implicated in regulation of membrane protease activity
MTQELSTLMRDEIRLAQLEVTAKAKKTVIGLGLFGGAGVIAWFGTGALVAAAILGIATVLDAWLAALIVGAALLLIAGLAGLLGRKEVSQAAPPLPEEAIAGTRADVRAVKQAARR